MLKRAWILCLTVFAVTDGITAESSVNFHYKDWLLVCDNVKHCWASGYSTIASTHAAAISFERQAGKKTSLIGRVFVMPQRAHVPKNASYHLTVNGHDLGQVVPSQPLTTQQVNELVTHLKGHANIQLSRNHTIWSVSDQGASAVFRKMDEYQGRLNTPSALLVTGNRSEDLVPDAPALPVIHKGHVIDKQGITLKSGPIFDQYIDLLVKLQQQECDFSIEHLSGQRQFEFVHLTPDTSLLIAACWPMGMSLTYMGVLVKTRPPYEPHLVAEDFSYYDRGELVKYHKGRGVGDCWEESRWVFDGRQFIQSSETTTGLCRGIGGGIHPMATYSAHVISPGTH